MAIHCPKCDAEIPDSDFNVATDVAYCRVCKVNYKYSELSSRIQATELNQTQVPKHVTVDETPAGMRIVYKKISLLVLFLIPFTLLWGGGSLTAIYILPLIKGKIALYEMLFGIPFLIGTVVLTYVNAFCLFGTTIILVGRSESFVSTGVGPVRWKTNFDLGNVRTVSLKDSQMRNNRQTMKVIELNLEDNSKVQFGAYMDDKARQFIAEIIASLIVRKPGE